MKFLVFQHIQNEHPGWISEWAKDRSVILEVVQFWENYSIPDVLDFDGLIILGGPMGVYENYPSEAKELETISRALGKVSIMGFCLGCQLLAHSLGAKVYPNVRDDKRIKEIGYLSVDLTKEGMRDPIFKGFSSPLTVVQWHGDAFDLPKGATLLATSKDCKNQALRFGTNAYGTLFHNEFTPEIIEENIKVDKEWIHQDYELDEEELRQKSLKMKKQMKEQCFQLMDNYLKIVTGSPLPAN